MTIGTVLVKSLGGRRCEETGGTRQVRFGFLEQTTVGGGIVTINSLSNLTEASLILRAWKSGVIARSLLVLVSKHVRSA